MNERDAVNAGMAGLIGGCCLGGAIAGRYGAVIGAVIGWIIGFHSTHNKGGKE